MACDNLETSCRVHFEYVQWMRYAPLMLIVAALGMGSCSSQQVCKTHEHELVGFALQVSDAIDEYSEHMKCVTPELRVAPDLCRALPFSGARLSQATDGTPHSRKLYHLYVSDADQYEQASSGLHDAPVGLTLVKQTHETFANIAALGDTGTQLELTIGDVVNLFVMMKVGESNTPNTDAGWVYATTSPTGEIESIGLLESCVSCHREAKHDRLFGLAPSNTRYFKHLGIDSHWESPL